MYYDILVPFAIAMIVWWEIFKALVLK